MTDTTDKQQHVIAARAAYAQSALADYFKEVIYGGIDGIVTTFAVVAGFTGAAVASETTTQLTFMVVLLFGLANLFADATSMGLGNFLSVRSEKDLYRAARREEERAVRAQPEAERAETIALLERKGFTASQAAALADIYATNETYWVDFMMQHERELPDPRGTKEVFTGLATFSSFMVFGVVPLLPFIFQQEGTAETAFMYSCAGTLAALIALALLKWRVIGTRLGASLFEVVTVGSVAAIIAFLVGTFFKL